MSDSGSHEANCIIYDAETLKVIDKFREGNSRRNGLAFIGHDYVISALAERPALKVWTTKQSVSGLYVLFFFFNSCSNASVII